MPLSWTRWFDKSILKTKGKQTKPSVCYPIFIIMQIDKGKTSQAKCMLSYFHNYTNIYKTPYTLPFSQCTILVLRWFIQYSFFWRHLVSPQTIYTISSPVREHFLLHWTTLLSLIIYLLSINNFFLSFCKQWICENNLTAERRTIFQIHFHQVCMKVIGIFPLKVCLVQQPSRSYD